MATAKKYKVFLSGAMESVGGNFNVPLFNFVAKRLRAAGCEVYNPADSLSSYLDLSKMDKKERRAARTAGMKQGLNWICDHANVLLMLPGWEHSPGAKAEFHTAQALGLNIRELPTMIVFDESMDLTKNLG